MRKEYIPSSEYIEILRDNGRKRLAMPGLQEAVIGGLAYLYDTQVRDDKKYSAAHYHFLPGAGMGHKLMPRLFSGLRSFLGNHIIPEKHVEGSWPGYIHLVEAADKIHAHPFLVATDHNLFTTVSTAYTLFLFEDGNKKENPGIIGEMLEGAKQAIHGYQKGGTFNFWRLKHYKDIDLLCPAPLNVPVSIIDFRVKIYRYTRLLGFKNFEESKILFSWLSDCYDLELNPAGSSAIFNIPNDADNTSMAVAFGVLYNKWLGQDPRLAVTRALDRLPDFRDRNRSHCDRYNESLGTDTGAFLTWLKDERLPTFSEPKEGVIPLGINNVDIVINSNVLLAMTLAQKRDAPGFTDAIRLIAQTITDYSWHDASLYYPQKYIFPYSISRAWRDAGIHEPVLDYAMEELMKQVLGEVSRLGSKSGHYAGAFPVNQFNNYYQSTALGLITLMNLGRKTAEYTGLEKQYDDVVNKAVNFLIAGRIKSGARHEHTRTGFPGVRPNYWESGVLYSSSVQQLAHWRSHAQTTALILEALTKYILAYDLDEAPLLSRRLLLEKHGQNWSLSLNPVT
jgi:hypothetical protein